MVLARPEIADILVGVLMVSKNESKVLLIKSEQMTIATSLMNITSATMTMDTPIVWILVIQAHAIF